MAAIQIRSQGEIQPVAQLPGITRRTMAWADQVMLCHFTTQKGGTIPLHQHVHEQVGCVVSGRVEFTIAGEKYIVGAGEGYAIPSNVVHGAVALEDSVLVEAFSPSRDEYR